jgi:hypothetical protein
MSFIENFGMTFAKKGHIECRKFDEMEMNQRFRKTLEDNYNSLRSTREVRTPHRVVRRQPPPTLLLQRETAYAG